MKTTKIFPIYAPAQKNKYYDKTTINFKEAYGRGGVYIIFKLFRSGSIQPVYVGSSVDAGKQCIRHFYKYKDAKFKDESGAVYNKNGQYRTSFEDQKRNFKFFVKFYLWDKTKDLTISDKEEIGNKEADLIKRLEPKYNRNLKTSIDDLNGYKGNSVINCST
jgi:hypothetical protein